jgi:hypothetical protein
MSLTPNFLHPGERADSTGQLNVKFSQNEACSDHEPSPHHYLFHLISTHVWTRASMVLPNMFTTKLLGTTHSTHELLHYASGVSSHPPLLFAGTF